MHGFARRGSGVNADQLLCFHFPDGTLNSWAVSPLLAHGANPVLIVSLLALLLIANVVGLVNLWSVCFSRHRSKAQVYRALFCLIAGGLWAYIAVEDGALKDLGWQTLVSFAPLALGIITLLLRLRLPREEG